MAKIPLILRLLAILVFSAAFSCSKDDDSSSDCAPGSDPVCGVCNPAANLPWLRDKIAELEKSEQGRQATFFSGRYKNQAVFVQGLCCVDCNWKPVLWTCDGQRLDDSITLESVTDQKWVWAGGSCPIPID